MKKIICHTCLAAALSLSWAALPASAANGDVAQAEALMKQGKANDAYTLLAPLEFDMAGDVNYDYLLGIAALDAGKPAEATLAFERVLAVNPNFAGARLDLARAYFAMDNLQQAKTEFEAVLAQNPPEAARETVKQHLAAIEARSQAKKGGTSSYLEFTAGHDNNVNNSTSQSQVYVPIFGATFTLSPTNVKRPDDYIALGGGIETVHPLSAQWSAYAGADFRHRNHADEKQFNTLTVDARAGASFETGADTLRGGILWGRYLLAGKLNRNTSGFNGEWRRLLDSRNQFSVFAQYTRLRYPDESLKSYDANQTIAGLGWLHALEHPLRPILFVSAFGGSEKEIADRADGNKHLDGLRFGGQISLDADTDLFASASAQVGRYDRENLAFQAFRRDAQYDLNLGLAWHPAKDWSVKPQLAYTHNDSNLVIYEYERTDISVTLRRDFR